MANKEKLHQILSSLWKNDDSVGKTYYNQALQDVQTAIDLQEEPANDNFEGEVKKLWDEINTGHNYSIVDSYNQFLGLCMDIADWQKTRDQEITETAIHHAYHNGKLEMKEHMIANAVDGFVIEDIEEGNGDFLLSADYLPKDMGLKDKQKVKVIVIKED